MAIPETTSPNADRVQLELLRAAGPIRRSELALSLSAAVITLSRDAIRRLHPGWSEREVLLEWARVHYGGELAERVRRHLERQGA